ncbi:YajG family lipoprotein [Gallaecimonas sp. GXIMD4217]|uniref:YajG family lipoprotein n=1 Tax=Gallaecimonas sp. GXIMD4217 TaxID=3131927 RepID=UPI00311B0996
MRLLLPLVMLLSGCATAPQTTWLDPAKVAVSRAVTTSPVWLRFEDGRSEPAVLHLPDAKVTGDARLIARLGDRLRQGLIDKGYVLTPQGGTQLTVTLKRLESRVDAGTFKHEARQLVVLEALASRDGRTLTRTFTSRGQFEAPLGVDVGRLEAELNRVLEQSLGSLVNDPELAAFFHP